jgi:hypothetical protein
LKWGLIVVAVLVAWRLLSGLASGIGGSLSGNLQGQAGLANTIASDPYGVGIYAPVPAYVYAGMNPFYSSPTAPQPSRWSRGRRGR